MNIQIDYKIKIQLYPSQVEMLLEELMASYIRVNSKDITELHDFLVGHALMKPLINKYQVDKFRNKVEGYVRSKPYGFKLNKLQCLWLYNFIVDRQLVELYHLHTNILGPHIQEYL